MSNAYRPAQGTAPVTHAGYWSSTKGPLYDRYWGTGPDDQMINMMVTPRKLHRSQFYGSIVLMGLFLVAAVVFVFFRWFAWKSQ
ncbi:hypothetical protein V6S67_03625 [Arthrobacter sp. Soc17.1.1.1]|uniref:hypothetical protein n=1 Tax=Arthrobacter sp. Soc17.1.1.1 TaxID=3121277 RepID=UPI002FE4D933